MFRQTGALCLGAALTLAMTGCYSPGGGLLDFSGGSQTYYSTEARPTTVTLVDSRTNDILFAVDIPPGKQLTIDFDKGGGDDPVLRPDILKYQIFDIGTKNGKLRSSLTVPPAPVRRLDVTFRSGVETRPVPIDWELRADQSANQPDWWTAAGGPLPSEDVKATMYDD